MVYSDTSTKLGIIEDITFLLGLDTNAYTLNDRTRNVNERFKMVWQMIFESYGGWQFIDDNVSDTSTGVPYSEQTLTSGTGLYSLPSAALTVKQVSFINSGGTRQQLIPITYEDFQNLGGDAAFVTNAVPIYYILQGDVIRILPVPNFTVASTGLRIYFDQGVSVFASTDTTKTPGFASPFHRMLSIGASLDYALARGMADKVSYLQNLWNDYERRLRDFYSKRFVDRMPNKIYAGVDLMEEFR